MVLLYATRIVRDERLYLMSDLEVVEYCQAMGLLVSEKVCQKDGCGEEMTLKIKKGNVIWRCGVKRCHAEKTVRDGSEFMHWEGGHNRLPIRTILHLIHHWIHKRTVEDTIVNLQLDRTTVFRWFALIRDVPYIALDRAEPMG